MKKLLCLCCLFGFAALAQAQSTGFFRLPSLPSSASRAPNDCLPAAMRVYQELPGPPTCNWKRILSARYYDGRLHHVYCVFSLGSQIYAYDNTFGSRRIFPSDGSLTALVRAVDFQAAYGIFLDEQPTPAAIARTEKYVTGSASEMGAEGKAPSATLSQTGNETDSKKANRQQ